MTEWDIRQYRLEDLVLAAIKSEIESFQLYLKLSKKVRNAFLREKLDFLAAEETRHKEYLQKLFRELFPGEKIVLPQDTPIPLPRIDCEIQEMPLSRMLSLAMEAERETAGFYMRFTEFFSDDPDRKHLLIYFSSMEMGHYKLLELEKENIERIEAHKEEREMVRVDH